MHATSEAPIILLLLDSGGTNFNLYLCCLGGSQHVLRDILVAVKSLPGSLEALILQHHEMGMEKVYTEGK